MSCIPPRSSGVQALGKRESLKSNGARCQGIRSLDNYICVKRMQPLPSVLPLSGQLRQFGRCNKIMNMLAVQVMTENILETFSYDRRQAIVSVVQDN